MNLATRVFNSVSDPVSSSVDPLRTAVDQWVSTARAVTREQLPTLIEVFRPYLKRIAEQHVPSSFAARFDASDVVQETLLQAFRRFDQFKGDTDVEFAGWMRGILLNQIVDAIRRHNRHVRDLGRDGKISSATLAATAPSVSDVALLNEKRVTLQAKLEQLPAEYRQVIMLRQEENLEFAEVGTRMGRSPDAARMLWARAIRRLSQLMHEDSV